jgi:hypothetical protein
MANDFTVETTGAEKIAWRSKIKCRGITSSPNAIRQRENRGHQKFAQSLIDRCDSLHMFAFPRQRDELPRPDDLLEHVEETLSAGDQARHNSILMVR